MSTTVSKPASDFEQVPEGTFVARCYALVFLGTQEVQFKGETKQQEKVVIQWELLDDEGKTKDGKPFTISKKYTRTLDERGNLYSDLNAWRGKRFTAEELEAFDMMNVLGAYAQLLSAALPSSISIFTSRMRLSCARSTDIVYFSLLITLMGISRSSQPRQIRCSFHCWKFMTTVQRCWHGFMNVASWSIRWSPVRRRC